MNPAEPPPPPPTGPSTAGRPDAEGAADPAEVAGCLRVLISVIGLSIVEIFAHSASQTVPWLLVDKQEGVFTSTSVTREHAADGPDSFTCGGRLTVNGEPVPGRFTLAPCGAVGRRVAVLHVAGDSRLQESATKSYVLAWVMPVTALVAAGLTVWAVVAMGRGRRRG